MSDTSPARIQPALLTLLGKDARMIIQEHTPINIETPLDALEGAITPREFFYIRNNHALPRIAPAEWTLTIDGHVERPYSLTYEELRRLPQTSLVAFLECCGNSRRRFADAGQPADGIQWGDGAIGNAEWSGVPVSLLLERASLKPGALQVECRGGGDHGLVRGVEVAK